MSTIHQIEANRLNARKSTGPRSADGKAAASRTALKSGIDAQSEIIRGEKPEDLNALTAEYLDRFLPATPEERHLVDTLIRDDWQRRRLARADAQIWEYEMSTAADLVVESPLGHGFERGQCSFERLQRRINATERSYKYALRELQQLQSAPGTQADARSTQPHAQPVSATAPQPLETKPTNPKIGFVPPLSPSPFPTPNLRPTAFGSAPPDASARVQKLHNADLGHHLPVTPLAL